jgi:hypothetical protein
MAAPQAPFRVTLGGQMPLDALLPASNWILHTRSNQALDRLIRYVLVPYAPTTLASIKLFTASNALNPANTIKIKDVTSFVLATNSFGKFVVCIRVRDTRLKAFVEDCGGTPTLTAFRTNPNIHHVLDTLENPHVPNAYQVAYRASPRSGGYMYFYSASMVSIVAFLDDYLEADGELNRRYSVLLPAALIINPDLQPAPLRRRRSRSADYHRRLVALADQAGQ